MISTHEYTAYLVGSPDVELSVRGGQVRIDAGAASHVTASITIAVPDEDTLTDLDPREGARVRLEVDATYPTKTVARTFDLGLRTRPNRHTDGTLTLDLASDEALLLDWAPLADDDTPFDYADSVRDIVDYVLGEVISGTTLETTPTTDADLTPLWAITNLCTNPSATVDGTGWSNGTNATGVNRNTSRYHSTPAGIIWASSASGDSYIDFLGPMAVTQGRLYVLAAWFNTGNGRDCKVMIRFKDESGATIVDRYSDAVPTVADTWTRVDVITDAPPGASRASIHMMFNAGAASQQTWVDDVMFYEGDRLVDAFDGSTTDDSDYDYDWQGDSDASPSTRTPARDAPLPEAFTWKAGVYALDFLAVLLQAAGLRLVCDGAREWTLRDADHLEDGTLNIRHGVNLIDAVDTISLDDSPWFDAAITEYKWTDANGIEQRRIDSYALNDPHIRAVLYEKAAPYPGPGFSEYAVSRAQGRGRSIEATTVADWDATAEQTCSVIVAGAPTQLGKADSVVFDLGRDEMTVTARTTDIPDAAWLLIPEGDAWTDEPIGEDWTEEVI